MKLPFQLPLRKKEKPSYFLALLLRDETATASLFEESFGKLRVIGEGKAHFARSLEAANEEEFLETLDKAISAAEALLPQEVETHKTIFGVKENWVEDAKIKKEYLRILKNASDALGLSPIGFLTIHEAIAHLLQKEEGAPVSAILVEVEREHLAVTLIRAGRIVETKRTKREDAASNAATAASDVAATTDRLLHHFTHYEVLPSRLIIFDGVSSERIEDTIQEFIAHQWSKRLPFLHVPQITPLSRGFDAKAVLFGAAVQMGFEVLDKEEKESKERKLETTSGEHFGFAKDTDVAASNAASAKSNAASAKSELVAAKSDLVATKQKNQQKGESKRKEMLRATGHIFLRAMRHFLQAVLPFIGRASKTKIFLFPPLAALVVLLLLLGYFFGVKADVVLLVSPKIIEKIHDVTFTTANTSDLTKNLIAARTVTTTQEASMETATTGKKEVGEKAKGTITLFSRLSESRTFPQNSLLTASNDLQFTLDKDITLASSSADASSPATTVKVSISAKNIGKEYNAPSGTKFTIGQISQSLLVGKNDAPFEGGTKKEIPAVAKEDLLKLEEELPKKQENSAQEALTKDIANDEVLLPAIVHTTLEKKTFSKNFGEEATKVNLSASVSYQTVAYKKEEIEKFATNLLKQDETMRVAKDGIRYEVKGVGQKSGKETQATITFKGAFLPNFESRKLSQTIAGKSFQQAQEILLKLGQVEAVDIALVPKLPLLPAFLPRIERNIRIIVETE